MDEKIELLFHYQLFNEGYISDLLLNNRIKFSNPAGFNDPWDCKLSFSKALLDNPNIYKANVDYAIDIQRRHLQTPEHELSILANRLSTDRAFLEVKIDEHSKALSDAIAKDYRVYCLSSEPDNFLMWAHYAKHNGVCFGFKTRSLTFCSATAITYSSEYPQLHPAEEDDIKSIQDILFTKSLSWSYEKEFRLIGKENHSENYISLNNGFASIDASDLEVIIVGCLILDDEIQYIRTVLASRSLPVRLYQVRPEKNNYSLVIHEL
jgi:Protein of unknown function (DUF2971)